MSIKEISRRHFLRGMGGSLLPVPFLSSLASPVAAAGTADVRKFVSVRSIYGQVPQLFYPSRPTEQVADRVYYQRINQGQNFSTMIGPRFASIAHKLSVIHGVDHSWGGHNHSLMLSSCEYNEDSYVPQIDTTLDEVLARSSIYDSTPPYRILRLEPYRQGFGYSWYKGERQPYYSDMSAVLQDLFKSSLAPEGSGEVNPEVLQALKAVDIAKPGYDKVRLSDKASFDDKARLSDYMDMLNDLEAKLNIMKSFASCEPPTINTDDKNTTHDAAIDLTVAALACGLTKVASLSMPTWGELPGENGTSFHGPSHWEYHSELGSRAYAFGSEHYAASPGSSDEAKMVRMYSYVADKVAELMTKMDSIVESNGNTLLDNSIVYWGNEQGGGTSHDGHSPPIVIGGTANGQLNPGYWDFALRPFFRYAGRADIFNPVGTIPYRNFLVTLFSAMGLQREEWEAYSGEAGFGQFRLLKFPYKSQQGEYAREHEIYTGFIENDTAIRRTMPVWFNGG